MIFSVFRRRTVCNRLGRKDDRQRTMPLSWNWDWIASFCQCSKNIFRIVESALFKNTANTCYLVFVPSYKTAFHWENNSTVSLIFNLHSLYFQHVHFHRVRQIQKTVSGSKTTKFMSSFCIYTNVDNLSMNSTSLPRQHEWFYLSPREQKTLYGQVQRGHSLRLFQHHHLGTPADVQSLSGSQCDCNVLEHSNQHRQEVASRSDLVDFTLAV